jgi:hypothetical protein
MWKMLLFQNIIQIIKQVESSLTVLLCTYKWQFVAQPVKQTGRVGAKNSSFFLSNWELSKLSNTSIKMIENSIILETKTKLCWRK